MEEALPPLPKPVEALDRQPAESRAVRELSIALVGEVRGEIQPCGCPTVPYGGFARREVFLDQFRAEKAPLFQLDAGEALLKGVSESGRDRLDARVEAVFSLMREVGVDVMVPGPTDLLARPPEGLQALSDNGGPKLVSSTWLDESGGTWFPPSAVLERGGVRLGVVGLSAQPLAPEVAGLVGYRSPVEAAREAVSSLPNGLDLVVAVSNLPEVEALAVADEVTGLAAILSTRGSEHEPPRARGETVIIETPSRGRYVTALRMRLGAASGEALSTGGPAVDKFGVLLDLRSGARGEPENLEARRKILEATEEVESGLVSAGAGRNLVVVEDRPLGSNLDGSAASERVINEFQKTVVEIAVAVAEREESGPSYAATSACISCHMHQFGTWAFSEHKKAWQSLVERGQGYDPECLGCHSTGFGEPGGFGELSKFNLNRLGAVQCEACHGPLKGHPEDESVAVAPITEATCVRCHDEANSPDFDYDSYLKKAACTTDPHGAAR
ncbi:MAG: multiheme c-type cytochrome [Myxococcota bacterium]|nr:multiheme c-type cytochrome [Myxococcota bacterium]